MPHRFRLRLVHRGKSHHQPVAANAIAKGFEKLLSTVLVRFAQRIEQRLARLLIAYAPQSRRGLPGHIHIRILNERDQRIGKPRIGIRRQDGCHELTNTRTLIFDIRSPLLGRRHRGKFFRVERRAASHTLHLG